MLTQRLQAIGFSLDGIQHHISTRVANIDSVEDCRRQQARCIEGDRAAGLNHILAGDHRGANFQGDVGMDDNSVRTVAGGHGAAPGLGRMRIVTDGEQLRRPGTGVQLELDLVPAHLHKLYVDQETVGCRSALILAGCFKSTSLPCRRGLAEPNDAFFVVDEQVESGKEILAENTPNPVGLTACRVYKSSVTYTREAVDLLYALPISSLAASVIKT